jgi:hypothetical protein
MADNEMTLEELQERAANKRESVNENFRRLYKLARGLGFDSYESNLLQNTTEENIYRLASEKARKNKTCGNCYNHLGGQCEVRELKEQSDGCPDWKLTLEQS